ncbi:MAG: hypothetical protein GF334_09505 [Candidatus Altiarchaeales archaeon]|nr:hypothetical protein [Candidatus Altiarchaeales archaeon]
MKQDINQVLMALLLVTCGGMVVLVAYFNVSYGMLNEKYYTALEDVENVSTHLNQTLYEVNEKEKTLSERERLLEQYKRELNLSRARESSLGGHFNEVKSEKQQIADQLDDTRMERNKWMREYQDEKNRAESLSDEVAFKQNRINTMKTEAAKIKVDAQLIEGYTNSMGSDLTSIESAYDTLDALNIEDYVNDSSTRGRILDALDTLNTKITTLKTHRNNIALKAGDIEFLSQEMLS